MVGEGRGGGGGRDDDDTTCKAVNSRACQLSRSNSLRAKLVLNNSYLCFSTSF